MKTLSAIWPMVTRTSVPAIPNSGGRTVMKNQA